MIRVVLVLFFISTSFFSNAQVSFALKGGINYANLRLDDNGDWRIAFHLGASAYFAVNKKSGLVGELLISDKGNRSNGNLHLTYLSSPLLYRYTVSNKFYIEAGSEFSFLASVSDGGFDLHLEKNPFYRNRFDVGVCGGFGYQFAERLVASLRYVHGFSNVSNRNVIYKSLNADFIGSGEVLYKNKNQTLQLSLSYRLKAKD